jgi:hypothetical protein
MHMAPVFDAFERIRSGERVFATIAAPPRFARSSTLLHALAWMSEARKSGSFIYATYSDKLAGAKVSQLQAGDSSVGVGAWKHGIVPCGVGGSLTGVGADLIVLDSPIKDRVVADNRVKRGAILEWIDQTLFTRAMPDCSIVVCDNRWMEDDVLGELYKAKARGVPWEQIKIPALDSSGESVWPSRWPTFALEGIRRKIDPYDWATMYMQEP